MAVPTWEPQLVCPASTEVLSSARLLPELPGVGLGTGTAAARPFRGPSLLSLGACPGCPVGCWVAELALWPVPGWTAGLLDSSTSGGAAAVGAEAAA